MPTLPCEGITIPPAEVLVGDAHARFTELGMDTYDLAVDNLNAITDIALVPLDFNVDFDFDGQIPGFIRPNQPDINAADFQFHAPADPGQAPGFTANPVTIDSAPTFTESAPTMSFGPKPLAPDVQVPTEPTDLIDLNVPMAPDYVLPPVPTLQQLALPPVPVVTLPTFTDQAPVFVEPPFNENWSFVPQDYISLFKDKLEAKILTLLEGTEALPLAIEQAIFGRMRSRIDVEVQRNVDQAVQEWASRGFSEPPGMLVARVDQIRQGGFHATAEASRDVALEQFKESLANMRLAIQQGTTLEGINVNLFVEQQRMLLQAAVFQRESALALLNARISVYNARLEGYKTQAQVYQTMIQAELAKVELYRAQLEGVRVLGELNEQQVRLYTAQLQAINTMVEIYKTEVEAVVAQSTVNKQKIDVYRAQIDAYAERWRANTAEWQGYSAGVEAEGKKADIYQSLVNAFAERVRAWSTQQGAKIDAERLRITQHGQNLEVWKGGLTKYTALIDGERARIAGVAQRADALSTVYRASADVEQTASAAGDRSFELGLRQAQADVDTQLKVADMKIAQAKWLVDQAVEMKKSLAQISAQLAASTMSAVSYGASVSSGWSQSKSCSQAFQFNGEIVDAG